MAALALLFSSLFSFRAFFVGLCRSDHSSSVSFESVAVGGRMVGEGVGSLRRGASDGALLLEVC